MKGEEQTHDGCCYTAIVSDDDMVNVKRKPSCGDKLDTIEIAGAQGTARTRRFTTESWKQYLIAEKLLTVRTIQNCVDLK